MYTEARIGSLGFDWDKLFNVIKTGANAGQSVVAAIKNPGTAAAQAQVGNACAAALPYTSSQCCSWAQLNSPASVAAFCAPSGTASSFASMPAWALPLGMGVLLLLVVSKS